MGVRFPSVQTITFIGPLPANATETVVLTTGPLIPPLDSAVVFLAWYVNISTGTGTTALPVFIRRGTTVAGSLVTSGNQSFTATAPASVSNSGVFFDTAAGFTAQQYSLTVIQSGATAAGTFREGALLAFVL